MDSQTEDNASAWEQAATQYGVDIKSDLNALRSRKLSLHPIEREMLGKLTACTRAIHLQCSHGQDTLALWLLGAQEVVGLDISETMLEHASTKGSQLSAPALWYQSDVLDPPSELDETADLVYTGKGALPWVMDLGAWAAGVARLLKPGGRFYMFEQHPLNAIWDPDADDYRLNPDGRGYFDEGLRESAGISDWAGGRAARAVESAPAACERNWTLGSIVSALAATGLHLGTLIEHPDHFWAQLPQIPEGRARLLPRTFSLVMTKAA